MLSKKSFGGNKRNFLKLLMRFVRSDVRDHIASQKNDRGTFVSAPESIAAAGLSKKITICEIFGVVRFSTFSTASTHSGHMKGLGLQLFNLRRATGRQI